MILEYLSRDNETDLPRVARERKYLRLSRMKSQGGNEKIKVGKEDGDVGWRELDKENSYG